MKKSQVIEKLEAAGLHVDMISKNKNGNTIIRKSFFYTGGYTSQQMADHVQRAIPNARIVEHGERWKSFKGGAGIAKQSHWYVEFNMNEDNAGSYRFTNPIQK